MQLKDVSRIAVATLIALAAGTAHAQVSTAFSYQGQLKASGAPVNAPADIRFSLFTAASGGTQVGTTITRNAVAVSNGLFTTPVDFGVNPYTTNQNLFLQIEVRNPAGSGSFVALGARQLLTPAPFSLATRGINVDAASRVGIGTAADSVYRLAVGGGQSIDYGGFNDGTLPPAALNRNMLVFGETSTVATGEGIGSTRVAGGINRFGLDFVTNGQRRLSIANTGNVGIGSAAPLAKLEVADGTGSDPQRFGTLQINRPDNITGSHIAFLRTGLNTMGLGYRATGTNVFGFGTGSTTTAFTPNRLAIDNTTGHIGINTTAPQSMLDVRRPIQIGVAPVAIFGVEDCGAPCGEENYYENIRLLNTRDFGQTGMGFMTEPNATVGSIPDMWIGTGFGSEPGDGANDFIIASKTGPTALTNRFRVNGDTGNVGIGTDSPIAKLEIQGPNSGVNDPTALIRMFNCGAVCAQEDFTEGLRLLNESPLGRMGLGFLTGGSTTINTVPSVWIGTNNGSNPGDGSNDFVVATKTSATTLTPRMTVNGDTGNVGIGTESPDQRLSVNGNASKTGGGSWAVLSDERTKTDIQPMTGTLNRLLQLKGHAYTYKPEFVQDGRALPGTQVGLVAQEVEAIFPDWVSTGPDGLKQVTERSTTALMVEALRDLRTEKDAEINSLKARLEKLEALLTAQAGK